MLTRWWERRSLATPSPELLPLFSSGPTASGRHGLAGDGAQRAGGLQPACRCSRRMSRGRRFAFGRRSPRTPTSMPSIIRCTRFSRSCRIPKRPRYQFKLALMWQLLLYGRAYAEIVRVDGRIVGALAARRREYMRVDRDAAAAQTLDAISRRPDVYLAVRCEPAADSRADDARRPITRCREVIGTALALQHYVGEVLQEQREAGRRAPGRRRRSRHDTAERLRDYWAGELRRRARTAARCRCSMAA